MNDGLTQADVDKQWPGFTVKCNACGSTRVELENTMGYSAESGSWGSIALLCLDCKAEADIVEA